VSLAFLYAKLILHWGFIVRQLGASAAQLAYVLPPPPTVVGSFMNPLARMLGLGETLNPKLGPAGSPAMDCALKATLAAAAGISGEISAAVYAEPSRIAAVIYKTGGDYNKAIKQPPYLASDKLLPVQAEGAASAPGASLILAWLVDLEILSKCLGIVISHTDLRKAAWSVYRIGSKEGLASILEAHVFTKDQLEQIHEGGTFASILYQPAVCISSSEPIPSVTLYNNQYRESDYYVPSSIGGPLTISPPKILSELILKKDCKAFRPVEKPELTVTFQHG